MLNRDELKKIGQQINSDNVEEREAARNQVRLLFAQLDSEDEEEQRAAQSALMAMGPDVHSFFYNEKNRVGAPTGSDDPEELAKQVFSRNKEEREESRAKLRRWVKKLDSEDDKERQKARDDLLATGPDTFPILVLQFRDMPWATRRDELLQILVKMCNKYRIDDKSELIKKMHYIVKDDLRVQNYSVHEQSFSRKILKRWGEKVPEQEVRRCHKCRKNSKKHLVRTCALPECDNCMCEEHAVVKGDEPRTKWYCSSAHAVTIGLSKEPRY